MTVYADPHRCPDCRATITAGAPACGTCALSLRGEVAQRLFATLAQADVLLASLRASGQPGAAGVADVAGVAARPVPAYPRTAQTRRRRRTGFGAASVPTILLTLGAGCLLVAALVFLAVAWSVLGVGGRTAALVVLTAVVGGASAWSGRRGLRGAAESLALVGYGLLALDLVGAWKAGWFADVPTSGFLAMVGGTLAVAGVAGALAAERTTMGRLVGAEVVSALGTSLVAGSLVLVGGLPLSIALVSGTLLGAAAALASRGLDLPVAVTSNLVVTGLAWLALTAHGVIRVLDHDDTWGALWGHGEVWPLLVAAAFVAALAPVTRLSPSIRVAGAAAGQLLVTVAALAPTEHLTATSGTSVGVGLLAVTGAAAVLLPRPWGLANAPTQALAAVGIAVVSLDLVGRSVSRLVDAASALGAGQAVGLLPAGPHGTAVVAGWLLPVGTLAVLVTLRSLAVARDHVARFDVRSTGPVVLGGALVATLGLYPVQVWTVVLATVVLALSVHLGARRAPVAAGAGVVLALGSAALVWTVGLLAGAEPSWVAVAGLLVLGVVVIAAPYAPARWWTCPTPTTARAGTEGSAVLAAAALVIAGTSLAPVGELASWTAVYLTVGGALVTVCALLRPDRRVVLGWVGGLLLAGASWVRLWDLGVGVPEAYALPSAAVLVLVGLGRLRRDRSVSTMSALAPGLSLALVPSLLWTLVDPTGARPLLLGLGALALVLAGARGRWTAPLVLGATVGAVLVVRLSAPYVGDAVPRWVLIGLAGMLLVAVGASWERRLAGARRVADQVRALR